MFIHAHNNRFTYYSLPLVTALLLAFGGMAIAEAPAPSSSTTVQVESSLVRHPAWANNAAIYEVNVRQYSLDGSFAGVERQLPKLKKMGVDILWLMPINPISKIERKGTLGSYYAVADYTAVNSEFGTLDDLKSLVASAHRQGMKVILDWVANHTGWDNVWIKQHPDWYRHNASGKLEAFSITSNGHTDYWSDVVGLNYDNPALWNGMIDAMAYWIKTADIDGFRCDVAWAVPTPFWVKARHELDKIKPVFMLAESDDPAQVREAFDMTYDWGLYHLLVNIAHGKADAAALAAYYTHPPKVYPDGSYRMTFTSDHDENSWQGSDPELYGDGFKAFAVLTATLPGMPLIYSGQESGLDQKLAFFEKDPILWKTYALSDFYAGLLALKHKHPALWNGDAGGALHLLDPHNANVFAFARVNGNDKVTVSVNLTNRPQTVTGDGLQAETLPAYGYKIYASDP